MKQLVLQRSAGIHAAAILPALQIARHFAEAKSRNFQPAWQGKETPAYRGIMGGFFASCLNRQTKRSTPRNVTTKGGSE